MLDFGGGTFSPFAEPAARRRRRHPRRARRRTPDRRRGAAASSTGARPTSAPTASTRSRPTAPPARAGPGRRRVRRRVPGRRRLEHAARRLRRPRGRDPAARHPRPDLRPARRRRRARWADFRAAMRDLFGTRLELRLGDPMDSEIDRKVAALVPTGPARAAAWCRASCTSSPRCRASTASADADTLGDGVDDLVKRVTAAWTGPAGPKLRLLPERISLDDVRALGRRGRRRPRELLLGINEKDLGPVGARRRRRAAPADLRRRPVRQERGAARLRPARSCGPARPQQAQLVVVDYRRSLLGEVPGRVPAQLPDLRAPRRSPALRDLATYLESRIPGPDVTPEQLRNRSWWTGAEVFVLVDDYDLVATQQGSPVARAGSRCSPRPATSACTWSSPAAPAAPRGRSTSRSSSRCATWPCRACCSPAAPTRARCSATRSRSPPRPAAAGWSPATAASRSCRWRGREPDAL